MSEMKMVTIKLVKSLIGRNAGHRACVRGLGLRRLGHAIQVQDTPENQGMIHKIAYLIKHENL